MPPAATASAEKGPVLLVTHDRVVAARVRALLVAERFAVVQARDAAGALAEAERLRPTIVLLDWALDDEPSCEELIYRLRPRRSGPRVLAIAGRTGVMPREVGGVRATIDRAIDADELVDLVWRHHHEVIDARRDD